MEKALKGKTIVVGVTGGIACYKVADVVSRLKKLGMDVFVVMTKNACEFVNPLTFSTLSNHPVVTDTFERPQTWEVEHVALAQRADVFLVAPATANMMAKMANGIADDMLSTTLLATKAPILVAPAMNTGMWENKATQRNVRVLQNDGVHFVGPAGGYLACGDYGVGRMEEPQNIVNSVLSLLQKKQDLKGLRVLVTAGATREMIDPVRYLTNRSSGKMGYAIAHNAYQRGAEVTLVTGPTNLKVDSNINVVHVLSSQDLYDQMVLLQDAQDVIIQAAAPADFTPKCIATEKIKKQNDDALVLELVQTKDIAQKMGAMKKAGQTLVAFAAETENLLQNAQKKRVKKHADLIVANDVSKENAGFDVDTNIVTLISDKGETALPVMKKTEVAEKILDEVLLLRTNNKVEG